MKMLPKWVLPPTMPSIFDSESCTTLEMTAKVYGAMQTLIEEYNKFADSVNKTMGTFTEEETTARAEFETNVTKLYRQFACQMDSYLRLNLDETATKLITEGVKKGSIIVPTDVGLKKANYPAEAKATGEAIAANATALAREISVERERINNLARLGEGSTTGDAELIDARVGADGKTYASLGDAIRTQVGLLNEKVENTSPFSSADAIEIVGFYNNNGEYVSDRFYKSVKMEASEGDVFRVSCTTPASIGFSMCNFYDANMNVLQNVKENTGNASVVHNGEIVRIPAGVGFITTTGRADEQLKLEKIIFKPVGIPLYGKTVVLLGDSIFGNDSTETGIANLIAKQTFSKVYNCAFGGTRMTRREGNEPRYDVFDFPAIVDAILSGNFSNHEYFANQDVFPEYFSERVQTLASLDFSSVDIIALNYATNDYTWGITCAEFETVAIEQISRLQAAFPHITIVLVSPTWRCWLADNGEVSEDSNTKTWFGGEATLKDYLQADRNIAESMNIPLVDVYNIGINRHNWMMYLNGNGDTTHHNEQGRKVVARVISSRIEGC